MSFFSIGPANGYCLVDFWLIWTIQAIKIGDEDSAARYASRLAAFAHHYYPCTRDEL